VLAALLHILMSRLLLTAFWIIFFVCQLFPATSQRRRSTNYLPYNSKVPTTAAGEQIKDVFINMSIGFNHFQSFQRSGILDVKFPYRTFNSNTALQSNFSGTMRNPFVKSLPQKEFDLALGNRKHFVDVNLGFTDANTYWWSVGYGHTLFEIGTFPKTIYVKVSLSVASSTFPAKMGSFDVKNSKIEVMGKTIDSTFTYRVGKSSSAQANVDYVNVRYTEKVWSARPALSLEWHPFKSKFFIEGSLAYSIPFAENGQVWLEPASLSEGPDDTSTKFKLKSPGLVTRYNSNSFTSSPFNIKSVQFGVRIGLTFHEFRLKRRK
jgi:hypothetical protein